MGVLKTLLRSSRLPISVPLQAKITHLVTQCQPLYTAKQRILKHYIGHIESLFKPYLLLFYPTQQKRRKPLETFPYANIQKIAGECKSNMN